MTADIDQTTETATQPSTKAWLVVNILVPLIPWVVACGVRLTFSPSRSWTIIDVKELALSFTLASLLLLQGLRHTEILLANKDKIDDLASAQGICWFFTAVSFALFVLDEAVVILFIDRGLQDLAIPYISLHIFTLVWTMILIYSFAVMQRSFKLRARIP